ncbi:MAG: hypothetical protein OTJ45_05160 [Alphaproteobacteria bacterium]|nr:hypothetical protein [Alphaproteobacteria bacterium]
MRPAHRADDVRTLQRIEQPLVHEQTRRSLEDVENAVLIVMHMCARPFGVGLQLPLRNRVSIVGLHAVRFEHNTTPSASPIE